MRTLGITVVFVLLSAAQAGAGILGWEQMEFSAGYGLLRSRDFWEGGGGTIMSASLGHRVTPRVVLSTDFAYFKYHNREGVVEFLGPFSLLDLQIGDTEGYQLGTGAKFFFSENLTGLYIKSHLSVYRHKALAWVDYEWGWDPGVGLGAGYRLQLTKAVSVYLEATYNVMFVDTIATERALGMSGLTFHF
jgi:hypothetical protein